MPLQPRNRIPLGDDDRDWFDSNAPAPPPTAPQTPAQGGPGPGPGMFHWPDGTYRPTRPPATATPSPSSPFFPGGTFNGDYQGYVNSLIAGKPPSSETLRSLAPDLQKAGITIEPANAAGASHKIRFPDGRVVRVGNYFDGGGTPSWGWVDQPGPGAAGDGAPQQAFTPPPAWTESFTAPNFRGPTMADLEGDVGYQEQLKRGQQAIERSAAARGTVLNPGTLKDLADYSQGTASMEMDKLYGRKWNEYSADVTQRGNEYGQRYKQYLDAYQQAAGTFGINYGVWNDDVNRFMGAQDTAFRQQYSLAQLGLQGANATTLAGGNYANQGGNAITSGADATASGIVGGVNAWNQGLGNAGNSLTSLYALSRWGTPATRPRPYDPYQGIG
jgi:hypothetical protein